MLVNWKGTGDDAGVLVVAPIDITPFKEVDAKGLGRKERQEALKGASVPAKQIPILPGWNEIDDAQWFLCRPHLVNLIDSGQIEEISREEKDPETGAISYVGLKITDFKNKQGAVHSPEKLVQIIRGCNSLDTLTKWLAEEVRDEMRLEIKKKIDELNTPSKQE